MCIKNSKIQQKFVYISPIQDTGHWVYNKYDIKNMTSVVDIQLWPWCRYVWITIFCALNTEAGSKMTGPCPLKDINLSYCICICINNAWICHVINSNITHQQMWQENYSTTWLKVIIVEVLWNTFCWRPQSCIYKDNTLTTDHTKSGFNLYEFTNTCKSSEICVMKHRCPQQ